MILNIEKSRDKTTKIIRKRKNNSMKKIKLI